MTSLAEFKCKTQFKVAKFSGVFSAEKRKANKNDTLYNGSIGRAQHIVTLVFFEYVQHN